MFRRFAILVLAAPLLFGSAGCSNVVGFLTNGIYDMLAIYAGGGFGSTGSVTQNMYLAAMISTAVEKNGSFGYNRKEPCKLVEVNRVVTGCVRTGEKIPDEEGI